MPVVDLDREQCTEITQAGTQCRNPALKGTNLCGVHTPVTKEEKYSIDAEIELIIQHTKRLRGQYQDCIRNGDDMQADMTIKTLADFARIKTDLIKRNQDTLENLADLIPLHELEYVIKETIKILDRYLSDQPTLLYRIKNDLITQEPEEHEKSTIEKMLE